TVVYLPQAIATVSLFTSATRRSCSGKLGTPPSGLVSMDFDPQAPVLRVRTYDQPGKGDRRLSQWSQLEWNFARNEVSKRSEPIVGNVATVSQDGRLAASFDLNERIIRVAATDTQRVMRSFP